MFYLCDMKTLALNIGKRNFGQMMYKNIHK